MGLLKYLRRRFISTIDVRTSQKVLNFCTDTNVIGIELLKKQIGLDKARRGGSAQPTHPANLVCGFYRRLQFISSPTGHIFLES